ncbi:MAG: nucleotide pyrophosphohydrolase, partial [Rubripirellula sp.]
MPTDDATTLSDLKRSVSDFVRERDWEQFHDPKNLVMAMTSEVGELADLFRWVDSQRSLELAKSAEYSSQVAQELADIV